MKHIAKDSQLSFKISLAIVLILLIVSLTPFKIITLLAIILLGGYLLRVNLGYFYKVILSFCILFALNTLIAGVLFVLKLPFLVTPILLLYIIILGYCFIRYPVALKPLRLSSGASLISKILLSIIAFTILTLPVLSHTDYSAYPIFSFSSDNISHIELLKVVENSQGYFYRPFDESKNVITEGLSGYPQGLHINMYFFKDALDPVIDLSSNYRLVVFIYTFSAAMMVVFSWLLFLATKGFKKTTVYASLPGGIATISLFTGLFFGLFALGSQSQVASMLLFIGMLAFFYFSQGTKESVIRNAHFVFALLMLGAITFTWLLLLPAAGLIAAYFTYAIYLKHPSKNLRTYFLPVASSVAIFCITLIQVFVQLRYGSPKNHGVNEQGFSITPDLYLISILVLSALLIVLIYRKHLSFWLAPIVATSGFSMVVYLYQLYTVGEPRYYLFKSLYVVIMVSIIIISLGLGRLLEQQTAKESSLVKYATVLIALLIASLAGIYNVSNPNDYAARRTSGGFSRELATVAIGYIEKNPNRGAQIITVGSCNRAQDYIATRLIGVLSDTNGTQRQALLTSQLINNKESLLDAIEKYQHGASRDLVIISSDYQIQMYLQKSLADKDGAEEFIDIDFGHIPKNTSVCPEAVR